jgi:hypothetical protein
LVLPNLVRFSSEVETPAMPFHVSLESGYDLNFKRAWTRRLVLAPAWGFEYGGDHLLELIVPVFRNGEVSPWLPWSLAREATDAGALEATPSIVDVVDEVFKICL